MRVRGRKRAQGEEVEMGAKEGVGVDVRLGSNLDNTSATTRF